MITRGIREFLARDWGAVRAQKDEYWRNRIATLGPTEGFRIAEELRHHAMLQIPGWPSDADRLQDLQTHIRVAELLHRACPTGCR